MNQDQVVKIVDIDVARISPSRKPDNMHNGGSPQWEIASKEGAEVGSQFSLVYWVDTVDDTSRPPHTCGELNDHLKSVGGDPWTNEDPCPEFGSYPPKPIPGLAVGKSIRARIGRGPIKNDRHGKPHTGDLDYHYKWYLQAVNVDQPITAATATTPQPTNDQPIRSASELHSETFSRQELRINHSVIWKSACDQVNANANANNDSLDSWLADVKAVAVAIKDDYEKWISSGTFGDVSTDDTDSETMTADEEALFETAQWHIIELCDVLTATLPGNWTEELVLTTLQATDDEALYAQYKTITAAVEAVKAINDSRSKQ